MGEEAWRSLTARAQPLDAGALEDLSPLLVIAPHPDDETLGCGGLIAACADSGLRPRVAFLTDGAASHRASPAWPPERLAAERASEALAALAILGVPEHDVRFMGWRDGGPHAPGADAHERTLEQLEQWSQEIGVRAILSPWEAEDHVDHQAASHLADLLVDRLGQRVANLDYLVWGWKDPNLVDLVSDRAAFRFDCPNTVERREKALACHRTQVSGLIDDAAIAFQVPAELAALTRRPAEIFLEQRPQ